jgi:hypothetical protein
VLSITDWIGKPDAVCEGVWDALRDCDADTDWLAVNEGDCVLDMVCDVDCVWVRESEGV